MDDQAVGVIDQYPDQQAPPAGRELWHSPGIYILDGAEFLQLTAVASIAGATVQALIRTMNARGVIKRHIMKVAPANTRTAATVKIGVGDGVLLDATIRVTGATPLYGQVGAVLDLIQSNSGEQQATATIGSGYVTATSPIICPIEGPFSFVDGPGAVLTVVGSVPAAGANISEVMPAGARREILSVAFSLTTSAAVANRQVALTLDDGANIFFRDSPAQTQAASLTDNYSFAEGQSKLAAPLAADIMGNLPGGNRMLAGYRMRTVTTLIDAADQYTAPVYLCREWLEL
jgi:hypothetical protein